MIESHRTPDIRRRRFLAAATGTSLACLVDPGVRAGALAAGEKLEKTSLTFGIIPLTDCAPIVIAREKGFFAAQGLDVTVTKESSWANIRDKVALGALDGAHMLAGMPLAATLGIGANRTPTVTAFSMDLNGNGITVSNELYERMVEADPEAMNAPRPTTARALKKVIEADKAAGKPPMTFAMVFPVSTHNYEIRYWMASAGIDPDRDIRLIVVPPPQMVANLSAGNIVGYCVGEPWNQRAIEMGIGRSIVTNYEIWNNNPEKVFGVNAAWAEAHPNTHRAVIRALIEAARWADEPGNRAEVVRIISQKAYVNAPEAVVAQSMTGSWRYAPGENAVSMPDFNVFYRYAATFPWRSHAMWFLTQMIRWGQVDTPIRLREVAASVYRPDLYREAAQQLGLPYPTVDEKTEGTNGGAWTLADATSPIPMGPDRFFDGIPFDPKRPVDYLRQFTVHSMKFSLDELARANA
jgi:ABC-type nitrate/sulfonate/bicarbonate transport system substrate-binding protein